MCNSQKLCYNLKCMLYAAYEIYTFLSLTYPSVINSNLFSMKIYYFSFYF
jgi:hypothetical protein